MQRKSRHKQKATKTKPYDAADFLADKETIAAYLTEALEAAIRAILPRRSVRSRAHAAEWHSLPAKQVSRAKLFIVP